MEDFLTEIARLKLKFWISITVATVIERVKARQSHFNSVFKEKIKYKNTLVIPPEGEKGNTYKSLCSR